MFKIFRHFLRSAYRNTVRVLFRPSAIESGCLALYINKYEIRSIRSRYPVIYGDQFVDYKSRESAEMLDKEILKF
jgi:hypothetical protein